VTTKPRPVFKQVKQVVSSSATPEELFKRLTGRATSHGYLRGPQQDVLREYADKYAASSDVAFELPTGTGKTAVGLLIAEWKRAQGQKVAYLSLTNQLAGQVLLEAGRLGLSCADLRGSRDTRDRQEEGRYRTGQAVAITTYPNLFNTSPVIRDADLLICDDAHGAEQYVCDMWTVSASTSRNGALYQSLLAALRPGLSESQMRVILDRSSFAAMEMADVYGHPECIDNVISVLDPLQNDNARYAWKLIRQRIHCCVFLVSPYDIVIRPLVPPTFKHLPFANAQQRIYMSATLGGESDLLRAYGIVKLNIVRARSEQWGRRYVFVPGVYTTEEEAYQIAGKIWDGMGTRRAVVLAPSDRILERTLASFHASTQNSPSRMGAADIEDSLSGFTSSLDVVLGLAGRYDGLDLPDEQCRLLFLSESPAAINALERHLSERWKMGPVLRRRERTRLTQGMGRCTRNATDFAVIIWLGQSLVNSATSSALTNGLPPELAAEIAWGVQQSELATSNQQEFVDMLLSLMEDKEYRSEADKAIQSIQAKQSLKVKDYDDAGADEVFYTRALWDENYAQALEIAHRIADRIRTAELSGYRAWWWFLASIPASLMHDVKVERDSLQRGIGCGVNSGWLSQLLQKRSQQPAATESSPHAVNAEALWDVLTKWGWAGPRFEQKLDEMINGLKEQAHVPYHQGLEILGLCFGATTTRTTEQGAPDVVWSFAGDCHLVFEAKTGKKDNGRLSKSDVQEAKGHPEWVRAKLANDPVKAEVETIIISASPYLHQIALPFAGGIFYCAPEKILKWAEEVADHLRKLRVKFSGREFAEAAREFSNEMLNKRLDLDGVRKVCLADPLKK
jgi:Helicase C-terminal domain/Type III restriction enzyme, res subunit